MNSTPKRLGKAPVVPVVAPKTGIDSSQGNAMVTPNPRRTARREMAGVFMLVTLPFVGCIWGSLRKELRTTDNTFYKSIKAVSVRGEFSAHGLDGGFVGQHQAAAESVREQLAA